MSKINSIDEAIQRLDALFTHAGKADDELKQYLLVLHAEKQNLLQRLNKVRQSTNKVDTTSSMHSKLTDALRE